MIHRPLFYFQICLKKSWGTLYIIYFVLRNKHIEGRVNETLAQKYTTNFTKNRRVVLYCIVYKLLYMIYLIFFI